MNHNERSRLQGDLDSRRMSTGARCEVVTKSGRLSYILELFSGRFSNFHPVNSKIFDSLTGLDPDTDQCYVVPKPFVEHVVKLLNTYKAKFEKMPLNATKDQAADNESHNREIATEFIKAIQDQVFLVTIQGLYDGKKLNGNEYDVYMHTREQSAPHAEMVLKDQVVENDQQIPEKWTDDVQDSRERFREILKDMSDVLKEEAKNGRESRRR